MKFIHCSVINIIDKYLSYWGKDLKTTYTYPSIHECSQSGPQAEEYMLVCAGIKEVVWLLTGSLEWRGTRSENCILKESRRGRKSWLVALGKKKLIWSPAVGLLLYWKEQGCDWGLEQTEGRSGYRQSKVSLDSGIFWSSQPSCIQSHSQKLTPKPCLRGRAVTRRCLGTRPLLL